MSVKEGSAAAEERCSLGRATTTEMLELDKAERTVDSVSKSLIRSIPWDLRS